MACTFANPTAYETKRRDWDPQRPGECPVMTNPGNKPWDFGYHLAAAWIAKP